VASGTSDVHHSATWPRSSAVDRVAACGRHAL